MLKKEEGEETPAFAGKSLRQHMREIEALRQRLAKSNEETKTALPTPKQRSSTRTTTPRPISDTTPDNDGYKSDSEDLTDLESESESEDSDTEELNTP